MIINAVMNLFIGLALTFGSVSLLVSAVTEGFASALRWRSATLLDGVKRLLNDRDLMGLALDVMNHARANPLHREQGTRAGTLGNTPSYIAPLNFAAALIDSIQKIGEPARHERDLEAAIAAIADPQLRTVIQGFYARAQGKANVLESLLANWFDTAMDRLSGDYKRRIQLVSFVTGASLAILLNIDAIALARILWETPTITAHAATADPGQSWSSAFQTWSESFPFGWRDIKPADGGWSLAAQLTSVLLGWLMTAAATLFGAPFWFDTLQRFVQLRGTGPKPAHAATGNRNSGNYDTIRAADFEAP